MRRVCTAITLTVLLGVAWLGVAGAEDLTIVSQVTPSMGKPTTSTQYISSDAMRLSDGQNDTIVDLEVGKLIQIDHSKKKYFEATFEEMKAHFAQLDEMIGSNPMIGNMMGKMSEVKVEKTAEIRDIAGYTCTKYVLTMGENFRQTMWVTPELKMPMEYYEASKMLYAMMGPMASHFEKMFDAMKEIEGFALATDMDMKVMGMDASSESIATEVRKGPIPDDAFAVPTGYKKKKSPLEN